MYMEHLEGFNDNMIANNLEPFYLTHPGEVIKDELEFRGISQRRLAKEIGVPASQLNELLNGKRALSAEMALLIGHALDIDAEPLLALQMKYNLLSAKRNKSFLERLKEIPKIAAIL
jgi:addiction module HigA family antidote